MNLNECITLLYKFLALWGALCFVLGFRKSIPLVFSKKISEIEPIIDKILLQKALNQCGALMLLLSFFFNLLNGVIAGSVLSVSVQIAVMGVFFVSLFFQVTCFGFMHIGSIRGREEYLTQHVEMRLEL